MENEFCRPNKLGERRTRKFCKKNLEIGLTVLAFAGIPIGKGNTSEHFVQERREGKALLRKGKNSKRREA